jgi:hypothetical protein
MYKINTSSGLNIKSLQLLRPVLRKWIQLNNKLDWFQEQDAPWWYNERASVSFYAGAVWQSKGWSFEEFSTEKIITSKRNIQIGRCDIVFSINDKAFSAEAKQIWPTLTSNFKSTTDNVNKSLYISCKEALKNIDIGYTCLGMVFVTPQLHISKKDHIDYYIKGLIDQLLRIDFSTIAWVFPKMTRNLRPDNKNRNYIFPGVILIIKKAG